MKLDYASAIINLRIKLNLSQSALSNFVFLYKRSEETWKKL